MTQACCSPPQDNTILNGDYGNSDYDVPHHFTANAVYDIPGSSHGPEWITHGWQLNTVMSFRTGLPFTVHATTNTSGTGENTDRVTKSATHTRGFLILWSAIPTCSG
jgi:hypothetical protein